MAVAKKDQERVTNASAECAFCQAVSRYFRHIGNYTSEEDLVGLAL
jgi:hypothetical protein